MSHHTKPAEEPFGLLSPHDVNELIRMDGETGALAADTEEIRSLVEVVD